MIAEQPCAPHFLSSLAFPCLRTTDGTTRDMVLKMVPFVLFEYYCLLVMMNSWFFSWMLIYVGLGWIQTELSTIR